MFVRVKGKEPNRYLQIVENRREGKRTLQRVVATLGRVDVQTPQDHQQRVHACNGSWPPWGGWTSWPAAASMPC